MQEDEIQTPAEQEQVLGEGQVQESSLPADPDQPSSGDPLDAIEDVDTLRGEAKKYREILKRKTEPKAPKTETPTPAAPAADTLTKRDLYRINSNKAVTLAKSDPAFANLDFEAVKNFYVNRRGQEDPDAIVEDLRDALAVYSSRNTAKPTADAGAELQTTTGKRTSGAPAPNSERKTTPILRKNEPMSGWYPKQS